MSFLKSAPQIYPKTVLILEAPNCVLTSVIVRFLSYKKRCEFLYPKSKLKEADTLNDIFITEDLTPLRIKLFRYLKNECCNQFVMVHTYTGKIRMKKAAQQTGVVSNSHNRDKGIGNWLTVTSPDDLFKINIRCSRCRF